MGGRGLAGEPLMGASSSLHDVAKSVTVCSAMERPRSVFSSALHEVAKSVTLCSANETAYRYGFVGVMPMDSDSRRGSREWNPDKTNWRFSIVCRAKASCRRPNTPTWPPD